jgi:hypothetical protein
MKDKPPKTPYLRFGEVETPIMGPAVEIVGNAKGLLQLRKQIDRALKDQDAYPLDDALYRDNFEDEYGVAVRKARSRVEMEPSKLPRPEEASERPPWAEVARGQEESRKPEARGD